jgi:hypothetical protein
MAEAAQAIDVVQSEQIRRMTPPDLETMGVWLVHRIRERYTEATPAAILGWLRGCILSNEMWFVRSMHCAALAQITRLPLEKQPIATEVFLLAQDGYADEAVELYVPMAKWAANHECSRLEVDRFTDIPRPEIKRHLGGGLVTRSYPHLILGQIGG